MTAVVVDVGRVGVVDQPLAGLLALLDEVGADERHVERGVFGVDGAVGEDDGDLGALGLLEHGVPAGLDDRAERDDVHLLLDVGPDRLDLVLLLLLSVGELQVDAGSPRPSPGWTGVRGAPAALGADLGEPHGDRVVVGGFAAATAVGAGAAAER